MGTQAEIPPVLDFIPREEVRGPREKPAQAFAALPADEALAVGHTSLRWAFPSSFSLLDPSPMELQPPNPAHSGLRAKPAHWVVPGMFMEHLGTTFAFVLPIKHKHDCLQQEGRVAPTQGTSWEVVTWNQRIPAWIGSCHSIPPAIPSSVCSQVTQHLHTVTASSSFPAQPMPGIDIPESHLTPRSCTQTLHSSFPESRAHPSLQCVQLPSLWSGRSRAIPWDAGPGNPLHPIPVLLLTSPPAPWLCAGLLWARLCVRGVSVCQGIVPVTTPQGRASPPHCLQTEMFSSIKIPFFLYIWM